MPLGPGDPDYDAWYDELQHYLSVRAELCKRPELLGQYVAMFQHQIIGVDSNNFALARRMIRERPGAIFLISKVEPTDPAPIRFEIRSVGMR